jgi:hypothetical protein
MRVRQPFPSTISVTRAAAAARWWAPCRARRARRGARRPARPRRRPGRPDPAGGRSDELQADAHGRASSSSQAPRDRRMRARA